MADKQEPKFTGNPNAHHPSTFSESITGTCLCGSISVTIKDPELFTSPNGKGHLCHCANCRKASGSYVAANLAIEKEKVEIVDRKGTLKRYEDWETASGKVVLRCFCGVCGKYVRRFAKIYLPLISTVFLPFCSAF